MILLDYRQKVEDRIALCYPKWECIERGCEVGEGANEATLSYLLHDEHDNCLNIYISVDKEITLESEADSNFGELDHILREAGFTVAP